MYGGTLQTFASCGHRSKFQPFQYCESYSPAQNRCNGTISVLHTAIIDFPALCVRCVSRIEANIIRESDLVAAELEKDIAEISHCLWVERNRSFNYIALIFERAWLRKALEGFWEEREQELAELREMHGVGRWDRIADLRDDGC